MRYQLLIYRIPFRFSDSIALSIYTVFHNVIAAVSNVSPLAR